MDLSPLKFGDRLRLCRRQAMLSQAELALAIGVHESTICRWERELKVSEMPLKHFLKIAEVTQTAVADLLAPLPDKRGLFEPK